MICLRSGRAFTLVEMLVIISIITVLAAILMPAIDGAREQANRAVCLSHLRAMGQGCLNYANDSDGALPNSTTASGVWAYAFDMKASLGGAPRPALGLGLLVGDYIAANAETFHCPSMDTVEASTPWHSMDIPPGRNVWGPGMSWFESTDDRRIIVAYNYRWPSLQRITGERLHMTTGTPHRVIVADTMDPRFGMTFTHLDGYHNLKMDGSAVWFKDANAEIDTFAKGNGVLVDGVNQPLNDEFAFELMESQ